VHRAKDKGNRPAHKWSTRRLWAFIIQSFTPASGPPRMRTFGRLLQRTALVLPPLSIVLQLAGALPLNSMLVMLIAAVALFYLGRLIEGFAQS
jgi:hypothetical protein